MAPGLAKRELLKTSWPRNARSPRVVTGRESLCSRQWFSLPPPRVVRCLTLTALNSSHVYAKPPRCTALSDVSLAYRIFLQRL